MSVFLNKKIYTYKPKGFFCAKTSQSIDKVGGDDKRRIR